MKASVVSFLDGVIGQDGRQFVIPVYQREYKWGKDQCQRLLDDILEAGNGKEHFTGSIICKQTKKHNAWQVYLVDGQQRVTTMFLILKALNLISSLNEDVNNFSDENKKHIYEQTELYLKKSDEFDGIKLKSGSADQDGFKKIMWLKSFEQFSRLNLPDNPLKTNFKDIYDYVRNCSKNNGDGFLRNTFFEGLKKLMVTEMILDEGDDPQEIFESINSLGLTLNNAELIRNYLLMSVDNQEYLYDMYWKDIQNTIGEENMQSFIFDYISMKTERQINIGDIYKEYKKFALGKPYEGNKENLLEDLQNVAGVYQVFIREDSSYSKSTNRLMDEIRDMGHTTSYPFLLRVFMDHKEEKIDEDCLDKVINLTVCYLARRTICGSRSSSLRWFFLGLYKRIFITGDHKKNYYDSVYSYFMQLTGNDRYIEDGELREALKTREIYSRSNVKFAIYLLDKIQNGRYPKPDSEITSTDDASVEHIMPQTLTEVWREDLVKNDRDADPDEIHRKYLNTLGNLSLSSRSKNASMSNDSFAEKKKILKDQGSKYSVLNEGIEDLEVFDEEQIMKREERLSEILIDKFTVSDVPAEKIEFDPVKIKSGIVIKALEELNASGELIFDPEEMLREKELHILKFTTEKLRSISKVRGKGTIDWAGKESPSYSYLEYYVNENRIYFTFMIVKEGEENNNDFLWKVRRAFGDLGCTGIKKLKYTKGKPWVFITYELPDFNIESDAETVKEIIRNALVKINKDIAFVADRLA